MKAMKSSSVKDKPTVSALATVAHPVAADAIFDPTGTYRYLLKRSWSCAPQIGFVMLNPNRADATIDDPTIRRCVGFAKSWGYGGLEVVNLFAYRAKTPTLLKQAADPVGPDNDHYLLTLTERVETIVLAWGNWGALRGRDRAVIELLNSHQALYCLGTTQTGQPRHPLYLKRETRLIKSNFIDPGTDSQAATFVNLKGSESASRRESDVQFLTSTEC